MPHEVNIRTASGYVNSEGIGRVRIALGTYEVVLEKVIHIPNLRLNIVSTERLKEDSYIGYSNLIPHCLYDGATGETLVEADGLSGIPVITVGQSNEIDHFQALDLHYTDAGNRHISCDLAHRRLGHISKELTRKLVTEMSTGLTLKGKESGNADRCDECMAGQMKAKSFPKGQSTLVRSEKSFQMLHVDLLEAPEFALEGHFKWLFVIIDDHTRYGWDYGLRTKEAKARWSE